MSARRTLKSLNWVAGAPRSELAQVPGCRPRAPSAPSRVIRPSAQATRTENSRRARRLVPLSARLSRAAAMARTWRARSPAAPVRRRLGQAGDSSRQSETTRWPSMTSCTACGPGKALRISRKRKNAASSSERVITIRVRCWPSADGSVSAGAWARPGSHAWQYRLPGCAGRILHPHIAGLSGAVACELSGTVAAGLSGTESQAES